MNRISEKSFNPLDQEESELMDAIENDQWQMISDLDKAKARAVESARLTLRKDKRINLRLTQKDYHQIQLKSIEEGIPYQTLISSLVHKYLNGSLVPKT